MSTHRNSNDRHPQARNLPPDELHAVAGGTSEFPRMPGAPIAPIGSPGLQTNHPFGVYGNVVLGSDQAIGGGVGGWDHAGSGAGAWEHPGLGSPFDHVAPPFGPPGASSVPAAGAASTWDHPNFSAPFDVAGAGGPFASGGLGASSISGYGPTASGGENAGIVTHTFDIRNWGDPHQNIDIDGHDSGQIDTAPSIHGFEVLHNTIGGATTISTQTTNQDQGQLYASFNREVDMSNDTWGLQAVASGDGQLGAVIHDAQGTHALGAGESVREADGTVITNDGHSIVVNEALRDGGHADTSISLNGASYIDMETSGEGNAGLGGWAAEHYAAEHEVQTETYVAAGTGMPGSLKP